MRGSEHAQYMQHMVAVGKHSGQSDPADGHCNPPTFLPECHLLILGVRSPSVGRDVSPESVLGWGKPVLSGRGSELTSPQKIWGRSKQSRDRRRGEWSGHAH